MMKKITVWIIAFTMLFCGFSVASFASYKQQLQVVYTDGEKAFENVEFSVYYLGYESGGKIIPDEAFSSYKVDFDISQSEKLKVLAYTLSAYIARDGIVADYTDTTDKDGIADFDKRDFEKGVYLITAKMHHDGSNYCVTEPLIAVLPYADYDVLKISPKFEKLPDDTPLSYKVIKAWVGDSKSIRAKEITVELLRDGKVYDTVVLCDENSWRYSWDGLSPEYSWTVTEKNVPGRYTVSISLNEKTFLLTNTFSDEEDTTRPTGVTNPDDTTAPPNSTLPGGSTTRKYTTEPVITTAIIITTSPRDTTFPARTTTPDEGTMPTTTTTANVNDGETEKIPSTGALRWPAPFLALAGVLLFSVGYVRYRKSELEDE